VTEEALVDKIGRSIAFMAGDEKPKIIVKEEIENVQAVVFRSSVCCPYSDSVEDCKQSVLQGVGYPV
jgi:hypothetical protein